MSRKTTVADDLIAGFTELADTLDSKSDTGARFNCYQMRLELRPASYTPTTVKSTRQQLGASQAVFAKFLGVTVKSVSQWERGVGAPSPIACRFMDEIRRNPAYYVARLHESLVRKTTTKQKKPTRGR